ncbi:phenylacetic acid degradation b [Fulvivirga sp. RKSG066]|uniref:phenylacetic acid degradation b n=1 Tax=Fulvivirga aurantia TaxID=2529383 RepID=UPI0012BB53F4|nr:phenylacetic acid degradation b [Fulvivirga aurantia]MTI22760.1 phenylacetic acid degradation b [Fulvivirga aurantia]
MESLDPRVSRLNIDENASLSPKAPLDQFGTFEVFVQLKEGKQYKHEGAVHAPNRDMAFIFAKEQFSRRLMCSGLFVVDTRNVFVTEYTEDTVNVYEKVADNADAQGEAQEFEFFHLMKRGKQHEHIGSIEAQSAEQALVMAKSEFINSDKPIYNVWVVKTNDILFSSEEDKVIWNTLPEKKFRDAIAYKAADKVKAFKIRQHK